MSNEAAIRGLFNQDNVLTALRLAHDGVLNLSVLFPKRDEPARKRSSESSKQERGNPRPSEDEDGSE